jgi:hypothetical protein
MMNGELPTSPEELGLNPEEIKAEKVSYSDERGL